MSDKECATCQHYQGEREARMLGTLVSVPSSFFFMSQGGCAVEGKGKNRSVKADESCRQYKVWDMRETARPVSPQSGQTSTRPRQNVIITNSAQRNLLYYRTHLKNLETILKNGVIPATHSENSIQEPGVKLCRSPGDWSGGVIIAVDADKLRKKSKIVPIKAINGDELALDDISVSLFEKIMISSILNKRSKGSIEQNLIKKFPDRQGFVEIYSRG